MVKFGNVLRRMPFLTQPSLFIRAWDRHRSHWTVTPMARLELYTSTVYYCFAQCIAGFDRRSRSEHLDLNAGSTSIVSQWNEEVALCSAAPQGLWGHSLYALIDQLRETVLRRNYRREPRHTLPQMGSAVKSSEFRVQFQKCAQVVEGSEFPQVRVELEVKNLEGGRDLSQLRIRDTVSDIINLQSSANMQDREYQTFSTDTLPAGSRYVVSYTASVKVSTHEDLFLPAFLTFSSTSPTLSVLNAVKWDILPGPALRGRVTPVFLSNRGGTRPSRPGSFPLRPRSEGPGAAAAPDLTEKPRSAWPDRKKPQSTEKSSVGSGAVLEPPAQTEAGMEMQGNRMETPDTTPVQGDGGDMDLVDEPVFKVPNKRKKQESGHLLSEPTEICKQTVSFYSKLYSSEWSGAQVVEDSFLVGLPKLSERADRELSLEELHEALQRMENRRAPGIDGLPAEFYKAFWAVIGQDVLDVLWDSIWRGELPLSCRRAVLTLLPKKGDLTHLKKWCLVSLLCTDCKLLSKALASRLTKVMERLIHQDQTYCVPDRSIFDDVYLILDILDVSRLLGLKTGLMFLDQEKAFDRVEHEYLWKVLETFRFIPGFIAMIKVLSSAKVNWAKSEAILVGEWGGERPTLPGGLVWKKDGFKYLGVYLGNNEFLNKNWEGTVEHVKGRLSRWKRLVPRMSYRGRTLVINNLAASSLWHKLACVDPPPNLLASIQALLVDFFWYGLHWIPQSVLHLPKEEGGQGLVQLASRTAAFRLQFLQRLLTGPKDLIWRPVAHGLLHKKTKRCGTLHWLLEEPLIHGGRLDISGVTAPALSRALISSRVVTLRELVNITGTDLSRAEDMAACLGLRSLRVVNQLLRRWRTVLTSKERVQLMDYQITETNPAEEGSFSQLDIAPDLDGSEGPLLECWGVREMDFGSVSGKLLYRACVKVFNKKKLSGRNDISLFRPVVANFTLRINTTEKVCMNHALHFAGFCLAFLISTLLLAFTLLTAGCFYKKCLMRAPPSRKRRSFNLEAEPEEAVCNTSDAANEDAVFEDRIIDIMALEDPQNMSPALDTLEMSSLLRAAVMLECVRVQMLKGVFRVLTAGVSGSGNEVSVVDLLSHVTDMQEDQESQLNTRSTTEAHSERQNVEQRRLDALRRREELHAIISEEIEEAAMTGGTHMANQLLHRYYICQDQLESVLDLFIANQRAALSEQQAQRRFLLQGLQDLQRSMYDMFSAFSRHIDGWFTHIRREGVLSDQHLVQQLERAQSELRHVQKRFEEKLGRERSSAHCDIIKTRRARISETLCEQKREQQDLVCGSVCDGPLEDYLMRWQTLLCAHNTHLSELITHLDKEAAAHIRRVLVCVLRDAVADLKQVECETSESLQEAGVPRWLLLQLRAGSVVGGILADTEAELGVRKREAAKTLQMTRSRIQTIREQELLLQTEKRERMHTYCRSVWESQCSLSESDLLRIQLEYVKSVCHLDCCLVLPHMLSREKGINTPANQSTEHTPDHASSDPCLIYTHAQVCVCKNEVCVCEDGMSMCEERVSMQVAAVQWDKLVRRNRALETHSALLTLQTLLMQTVSHAPVGKELSHAIHTHSLALEEAELLLQKEESEWERSMDGFGFGHQLLTPDEEELFQINTECMSTECLQEALYKRQQLTHTLTERLTMEIRRQQVMEDLREQQELKRLYTHFNQDLLLVSLLVKLSGITEPVLHQLLCLLLPTQPEGELHSLIHTLAPKEGWILGPCCHLVDRLRNDVISKHMVPASHTHTDRMLKKKQKLVEKLFSRSHGDHLGHDSQPACSLPITEAATQKEASSPVVGESTPDRAECTSHAGEVDVAEGGDMVEEKLFTVHNTPLLCITDASHVPQSHGKRKKFKFKKGTVAPQEQT
ncbi:hypothetical protein QTP86_031169 [Hemibagrus guttatus]|nr:hypothetical protein QTP86_031169 [Hemibagrus guttatus]